MMESDPLCVFLFANNKNIFTSAGMIKILNGNFKISRGFYLKGLDFNFYPCSFHSNSNFYNNI